MTESIRIVVPDTGPLITLAKIGALNALLAFREDVRIVLTDYVEFEATRRRKEMPDAAAIHRFIRDNGGRVEIATTGVGSNYKKLFMLRERLQNDPDLAKQLGVDLTEPSDPGELSIVQYVRDLVEHPPGTPVLILAEDEYFLREVAPLPGNAHVLSTRAFLRALPEIAKLSPRPELWAAVEAIRSGADKAKIVDRPAYKISTSWPETVVPEVAAEVARSARKRLKG